MCRCDYGHYIGICFKVKQFKYFIAHRLSLGCHYMYTAFLPYSIISIEKYKPFKHSLFTNNIIKGATLL